MGDSGNETYSEEETVARREAAIQRMLKTPHKPHKPTGLTPSTVKKSKPHKDSKPGRRKKD